MYGRLTRGLCAVAAGALICLGLTQAGAAGAGGTTSRAPAPAGDPVTAYVAGYGSGTVTPIRTATNTALKSIKVGVHPDAIAITPDGKTAYVAK